jgi:RNA polymerase sigma-70 factor (ECF subfamily)
LPEQTWLGPIGDDEVVRASDPAERAVLQDSVRLAFVAALQHLPPRQRAVLVLREVLAWSAADVADLLDTSVASVNSLLQRARATVAERDQGGALTSAALGAQERDLLSRYVTAFEQYDIDALVQLLHEDASMSMPPLALWLRGRDDLAGWYLGHGTGCRGSRLLPVAVNGQPGFAQYRVGADGGHTPWGLHVLEITRGRVAHIHTFLDAHGFLPTGLFPRLGLPPRLD